MSMIREFKSWRACRAGSIWPMFHASWLSCGGWRTTRLCQFVYTFLLVSALALSVSESALGSETVKVAVNGQDDNEKLDAYRIAMRWLLQRRTAGSALANSEEIRAAIREAGNYVDEFEFQSAAETSLDRMPITGKVRETGQATHILTVTLSAEALDRLIAEQSLELEEPDQPSVTKRVDRRALVWLLVVDEQREIFVSEAVAEPVVSRMRELAGGYAWNIYFPALDTLDLSLVGPDDLLQQKTARIEQASTRYQLPQLLTGVLTRQTGGRWSGQWTLVDSSQQLTVNSESGDSSDEQGSNPGSVRRFDEDAATLDEMLQRGVAWLVGEIDDKGEAAGSASSRLSANTGTGFGLRDSGALLWLGNIHSTSAYAKSMRFLGEIEELESVQPVFTAEAGMLLTVLPRSAISAISLAAADRSWLQQAAESQATAEGAAKADLYLNVQP